MYQIAYILFHGCDFQNIKYGEASQFFSIWLIIIKQCRRIEVNNLQSICDLLPNHALQDYFGGNTYASVDGL